MQSASSSAAALQKVARVVVEKESTGRHVLLHVSSGHGRPVDGPELQGSWLRTGGTLRLP